MSEVVITDESTEAGAFRALKAERSMHKQTERKLATLRGDLAARVERLEQRGLSPVLGACRA